MATATQLTILHRGGTPRKPPCDCGQPGLEWVATAQGPQYVKPQGRGAAKNAEGWGQWRIVPFGTDDFTGKVHPTIPCHGKSDWAQGKRENTPDTASVQTPWVDTAPTALPDIDPRAVAAATPAPIVQAYDDSAIIKRLGDLEDAVGNASPIITDMLGKLDAVNTNINVELKAMKDEIAARDKARSIQLVTVTQPTPVDLGRQHFMFENFLATVIAIGDSGVTTAVGEAGSMKSSMTPALAKAIGAHIGDLNFDYESETFHPDSSAIDVLGFISPITGQYVESKFRRAYEHGKLMAMDEITRAPSEASAAANGITSGRETGFPDKIVKRHQNCYFVAYANTFGRSHDSEYVGAQQLDAATLSRLVFIPWNTDWDMLAAAYNTKIKGSQTLYQNPGAPRDENDPVVQDWGQIVIATAEEVQRVGIRAVISSRAFINGYKMLRAGIDEKLVRFATIWALMSADEANQVRGNLGLTY